MYNLLRYEGKQAPLFYFRTLQRRYLHFIPDTISNHHGSCVILNAENGEKITIKKD
jgi:hypothetical protein